MIRALAALTRQAQEFFHTYLVGIIAWDEVEFAPRERNENPPPAMWARNRRGRRIRPDRLEGKHRAMLRMEFGLWRMTVEAPSEHPPLGWLTLEGAETLEGPLDAATWKRFGDHIKEKHKELTDAV
jgi:hypothetical protein